MTVPTAPTAEVERLLATGDYRAAADRLLIQAAQSTPPQQEELRLAAAMALLRGQYWDDAEQIIAQLPTTGSAEYRARLTIAQARLLIARNQAQTALQRLNALGDNIAPVLLPDYHRARADAYAAAGNPLESARERIWLDGLLDPAAQVDNHQAIWEALSQLPDNVLRTLRTAAPPDVLSGWMELVETVRAHRDNPQQLEIALGIWRERYPGHPAAPDFISRLQQRVSDYGQTAHPGQIGVLLPLSGSLAEAGQALRDGILAAYYQMDNPGATQLRFYDTGTGPEQIWPLYQRAVAEGAQQIIGPLTKESVAALAGVGTLDVPVLALNTLSDTLVPPAQLYQYSLSPEDEAGQVAERAWQDGHRYALVLIPEGSWGDRLLQAFMQQWQTLGGTLLEVQRYGTDQRAYSNSVRDLLNIDASQRRMQALSRLIGRQPEFEPRRRQDADFVFLVANAQQARLLRPLLRFYRASRLPVYTTSQVHEGSGDANLDRDLDGLRFCDMPWMLPSEHPGTRLRTEIARLWPEREQRYTRLYAMGIDALEVAPYLRGLNAGVFSRHPGVTGDLYLDSARRVHRDLQWSEFRNGTPVALPPSIAPESEPVPPPMDDDSTLDSSPAPNPTQDLTDDYPATATTPSEGNRR